MNAEKLFVFFGATGNLFSEKIFPAFYHLTRRNKIDHFRILAIGRRFGDVSSYHSFLRHSLEKKIPDLDAPLLENLLQKTSYYRGDIAAPRSFPLLFSQFRLFDHQEILFYLSTLPSLYTGTLQLIQQLTDQAPLSLCKKIIIEKPFGFDQISFEVLNRLLKKTFSEENIFFVDHYLGKDTVQNVIILKAENFFIEKLLSAEYVEEIHIVVSERDGVGSRGKFFEETGAIRDILQNHALQLLSLIAMDIPALCDQDKKECNSFIKKMSEKKIEVVQHLELPPVNRVHLGQYQSYGDEISVPFSQTETLISLPLFIPTRRWSGVPFWMVTGKKMAEKKSSIEVVFRSSTQVANRLIIEIQPEEKIDLVIHAKIPGEGLSSSPVRLNFNSLGTFGINSPEAYENILLDCYRGDKTLFPDSQFILHSWKVIDKLKKMILDDQITPMVYPDHQCRAEDFF